MLSSVYFPMLLPGWNSSSSNEGRHDLLQQFCFWNNDLVIMCQRKSFFFKSLILHEIMKFLKISFFCTENFWPKISAAILIWGYNSTWKLKNIVYKLPHFANFTSCSKKDFDHSTKIYIHFSFSLTINTSSIVRWLKTMFTMFMNSIYSEC